jgi:Domain of unknown function (DUF4351)
MLSMLSKNYMALLIRFDRTSLNHQFIRSLSDELEGLYSRFAAWKVRIDLDEVQAFLQQEVVMAYPQAFLDWEEATKASSKREQTIFLVLRLLNRRCGELSPAVRSQVEALSLTQLEQLSEDLLDFSGLAALEAWLD